MSAELQAVESHAPNSSYREVSVIRDPDGCIAVVSERLRDGLISFAVMREFEQKGETKRSSYLARRHIAAVRRLLADLEERLELAEDQARARRRDR